MLQPFWLKLLEHLRLRRWVGRCAEYLSLANCVKFGGYLFRLGPLPGGSSSASRTCPYQSRVGHLRTPRAQIYSSKSVSILSNYILTKTGGGARRCAAVSDLLNAFVYFGYVLALRAPWVLGTA